MFNGGGAFRLNFGVVELLLEAVDNDGVGVGDVYAPLTLQLLVVVLVLVWLLEGVF